MAGALGDAVADVIHCVVAGHVLLLQEEGGVGLPFGENRDEHVGAGHLFAARRLDMEGGALDDALESVGRLRLVLAVHDQVFQLGVEVVDDRLAKDFEVDPASPHHRGRIDVVDEGEEQMLEGRVFVPALVRQRQGLP